jgi:hypothetical protein
VRRGEGEEQLAIRIKSFSLDARRLASVQPKDFARISLARTFFRYGFFYCSHSDAIGYLKRGSERERGREAE